MLDTGVDVVRINASHGTPEIRAKWINDLQTVQRTRDRASAILVDLHGPRICVGELTAPIQLSHGQEVVFAPEDSAREGEIPTTYQQLAADLEPGARILLDD